MQQLTNEQLNRYSPYGKIRRMLIEANDLGIINEGQFDYSC